ncbi:uncharacterized protein LOC116416958 isoform X2 [Nasonia vitripennis]|uniref:Uncharacterized protein n=1 Tax=Nasonia vitripennis TaxID=7425 RepID=A0A7M7Q8T6_NASVI|nr:uncharacterized protein LOC116416958 isoform X2 [Nasonia vitripennis]
MDKDWRTSLLKKYLIPSNCSLLNAPQLNAEVKSVISSIALKKDNYNETRQQQLGAGITAIAKALTALLNSEEDGKSANLKALLIEHLGDGKNEHTLRFGQILRAICWHQFKLQSPSQEVYEDTSLGRESEVPATENSPLNLNRIAERLSFFLESWKSITNDDVILGYVKGYKIPIGRELIQTCVPKMPKFSFTEFEHCKKAIGKLLVKGAISKCSQLKNQFLSPYFLRDKPDGSKRFILNLKGLNLYIKHFKMQDKKTVMLLLEKNDFMTTIDLLLLDFG